MSETIGIVPQTEGAGGPPKGRTAVGSGFSGDTGGIPPSIRDAFRGENGWPKQPTNRELEAGMFWGLHNEIGKEIHDPTYDSPLLRIVNRVLDKYLGELISGPVDKKRFQTHMRKLDEAGVIRKRAGMSFRRYIGLILDPVLQRR